MKIDNHAHVFNLHFIPVAGVIRDYSEVFLGEGRKIPVWICNRISNHYLHKTKDPARFGKTSGFIPQEYEEALAEIFEQESFLKLLDADTESQNELYDFLLFEEGETFLFEFKFNPLFLEELGVSSYAKVKDVLGRNQKQLSGIPVILIILLIRILTKAIYKRFLEPYFTWFNFMTKPYKEITKEMIKHFKEISLFVHLDMDMSDWYTLPKVTFDYDKEQVPNISKLVQDSDGKIVPFYAYNPKKPLQPLKDALGEDPTKHLGYIGVKFYPPSGYLPIGNIENPAWDTSNLALFHYCVTKDIPILSHCNKVGMQAGYQRIKKANPIYWRNVLNYKDAKTQKKSYQDLILCLGHAGGDEEWFYENTDEDNEKFLNSYAGEVYRLCTEFKNVYCDFSYMPEITNKNKMARLLTRLLYLFDLSRAESKECLFEDKIIYGSDWHMIMQEHGSDTYLPSFSNLFKDVDPATGYEKKFFSTNAIKFLNIRRYIDRFKTVFLTKAGEDNLEALLKENESVKPLKDEK